MNEIIKNKSTGKSWSVLLIEDNENDVFLTELALKKSNIKYNLDIANNGKTAIELFNSIIKEEKKPPDLILLDINLPVINGLEVLKYIKSRGEISFIPTVVFTSSDSDSDIKYCYDNGADLYVNKPNNINDFKEIIQNIKKHCLKSG